MEERRKKLKVLVVDDDQVSRLILKSLIEIEGYEVKEAENGEAGLRLFKFFQPDLVLSDISMPIMNGLKMLEEIRKMDDDAVVIMTTAFGGAEYTLKALRLRANDYLVKPIKPKDLFATLRKYSEVLSEKTAEREIPALILNLELTMKLANSPELVARVVDRLMQETEGRIAKKDRLGVRLGLIEIILNAIEHGNLGITYDEKTRVLRGEPDDWNKLIDSRRCQEPWKNRQVLIEFQMDSNQCCWTITDDGDGFDWEKAPRLDDPEILVAVHGRGIILTRMSFDQVTFLGKGNQVRLCKLFKSDNQQS